MRSFWLPAATLAWREVVRFLRQPSRIAGAVVSPLLFWVLIGSGLAPSFQAPQAPGVGYLEYFYPGTLALVILFAAIFSTISVIEDRHTGFLQGVLVAPVPRAAIVAGKVLGGTTLAMLQGALFLPLAPLAGFSLAPSRLAAVLGALGLLALFLTTLGFVGAWVVDSVQGFHAVMNLVLVPLWLLSGAFFPVPAAGWLAPVMAANPLTYGVAALRHAFGAGVGTAVSGGVATAILGGATVAAFLLALWVVRGDSRRAR
ncbi:MAG: ABC transporter permease [Thermoanaerobaculia bacterium]|nr:ABC transporter permease [Thermoanaerobaculia bacterium]